MFRTRLVSGIVLLLLALILVIAGGPILALSTCAVSIIGMYELYRVFGLEKSLPANLSYLVCAFYYGNLYFGWLRETMMIAMIYLILLLSVYVFSYPKYKAGQIMKIFFGLFYVAFCLSFIYQTRSIAGRGSYLVWLIFLCSWGCDTCAYAVGVLIGKHKMAPVLSPKKSIEGAVGGVIGSALLTGIYACVLRQALSVDTRGILLLSMTAAVGALISMVGDLAASAIKRNYEIKDYGRLIPGHGGILDRFDSVIITAPIVFYLLSNLTR